MSMLDYQLQFEKVMSLGKSVDGEYAGSMLLDPANVTMVERQLVLATTGRSLEFHRVANALRQFFCQNSFDDKGNCLDFRRSYGVSHSGGSTFL